MVSRLLLMVLSFSLLLCQPVYAASGVGQVVYTTGSAWVERAGEKQTLDRGFQLLSSDFVVTGERGRAKLLMSDGSKVYVGAKSRLGLSKYSMRGKNLFQASFDMVWGKARFFVNKLVARDASFKVRTSTAVLGVRGTSFLADVPKEGGFVKYTVMSGVVEVIPLDEDGNEILSKKRLVKAGETIIVYSDGRIEVRKATEEEMGEATVRSAAGGGVREGGNTIVPLGDNSTVIQNQNGTTPEAPTNTAPTNTAPPTALGAILG